MQEGWLLQVLIMDEKIADENSFYVGIFNVDKISRMNMDAEKDGIMTASYLHEPSKDFEGKGVLEKFRILGIPQQRHRHAVAAAQCVGEDAFFLLGEEGKSV